MQYIVQMFNPVCVAYFPDKKGLNQFISLIKSQHDFDLINIVRQKNDGTLLLGRIKQLSSGKYSVRFDF